MLAFLSAIYFVVAPADVAPVREALGYCWTDVTEQPWPVPGVNGQGQPITCSTTEITPGCTYYYLDGEPNADFSEYAFLADSITRECGGQTYETSFGLVTIPSEESDEVELEDTWFFWYCDVMGC
jgi:hypothetical protein